jgi:hypothetical protein
VLPSRVEASRPGHVFLSGLLLTSIVLQILCFWPLKIDDAYIAFRFARNLSEGNGFVWNVGDPPVEGMTSLLWVVLLAPVSGSREHLYTFAKLIGLLATLLGLAMGILTARALAGGRAVGLLMILLASSPVFVFQALNGLETGLAVFWVSAMLFFAQGLFEEEGMPRSLAIRGSALYALAWFFGSLTRPELVLYGGALAGAVLPLLRPAVRRIWLITLLAVYVVPGLVFFLWRWRTFHLLLPLSYYAKKPEHLVSLMGLGYVLLCLAGLTGGSLALMALLYGCFPRGSRERRALFCLAAPSCLLGVSYLFTVPTMGFVYRFVVPFLLPLLMAVTVAWHLRPCRSARRSIGSVLVVLILGQLLSSGVPAFHFVRVNSLGLHRCHEAIGHLLATAPHGRLLALSDVGAVSYFSGWHSAEGVGLVTPAVLLEKRRGLDLIQTERPDVIMMTCLSRTLDRIPGYSGVRAVPWLVFKGRERSLYQCVYVRDGYPAGRELSRGIDALHAPEMSTPRYFHLYEWLKQTFGQSVMRVSSGGPICADAGAA